MPSFPERDVDPRAAIRSTVRAAIAEAARIDALVPTLGDRSDLELEAMQARLAALLEQIRAAQSEGETGDLGDVAGKLAIAVRAAEDDAALVAHVLHMRQPRPDLRAILKGGPSRT